MAGPFYERRRALDGKDYTFVQFVRYYGKDPEVLKERWAAAPKADSLPHILPAAEFDARAVAVQLCHAFGSECLLRALKGWWCPGKEEAERVALEILQLDSGFAAEYVATAHVKELARLVVLLSGTGYSQHQMGAIVSACPPGLSRKRLLALIIGCPQLPRPVLVGFLRLCQFNSNSFGPVCREVVSLGLFSRFRQDRSGLWQVMEAGVNFPSGLNPSKLFSDPSHEETTRMERFLVAWQHGEVVRRRFLARSLSRAFLEPAAAAIAAHLCGDLECRCSACRAEEAVASSNVQAEAASRAELVTGSGATGASGGAAAQDVPEVAPVEEVVVHSEPAAIIHPEEAALVSAAQWATAVDPLEGALPAAEGSQALAASSGSRVVLLEFSRRPKEMYRVLLDTDLAVRLVAEGVDVQPSWAGNGLVLVAGAEEGDFADARGEWHVAVRESDEEAVYDALRLLGHTVRPRLKAMHGREYVPDRESLMMDLSEGGQTGNGLDASDQSEEPQESGVGSAGAASSSSSAGSDLVIPVFRTFIHFREPPPSSADGGSAQSAPP